MPVPHLFHFQRTQTPRWRHYRAVQGQRTSISCEGSSFLGPRLRLVPMAQASLTPCLPLHMTAPILPTNPILVQRQ